MHVFELSQQWLLGRFASAQREAADAMLIEADFATHQALRPLRMDFQCMTQNIDTAQRHRPDTLPIAYCLHHLLADQLDSRSFLPMLITSQRKATTIPKCPTVAAHQVSNSC